MGEEWGINECMNWFYGKQINETKYVVVIIIYFDRNERQQNEKKTSNNELNEVFLNLKPKKLKYVDYIQRKRNENGWNQTKKMNKIKEIIEKPTLPKNHTTHTNSRKQRQTKWKHKTYLKCTIDFVEQFQMTTNTFIHTCTNYATYIELIRSFTLTTTHGYSFDFLNECIH